ncbi:unnamed protein product, partial [Staurois parvus]
MYIHRNTHTLTHVHTYTDTCTHRHMYIDTHKHTHRHIYTHTDTCTDTHMYIHTDTCTTVHAYTDTHKHTHMYTHTHTHKKLQYFVVHSQIRVLHSRGRQRAQHTLLCFHCTKLLSSLTAPSANDRSGLSSESAQQDSPGGHTRPHHNFHSPLARRRVEISSPAL